MHTYGADRKPHNGRCRWGVGGEAPALGLWWAFYGGARVGLGRTTHSLDSKPRKHLYSSIPAARGVMLATAMLYRYPPRVCCMAILQGCNVCTLSVFTQIAAGCRNVLPCLARRGNSRRCGWSSVAGLLLLVFSASESNTKQRCTTAATKRHHAARQPIADHANQQPVVQADQQQS